MNLLLINFFLISANIFIGHSQRTIDRQSFLAKFTNDNLNDYWHNITLAFEGQVKTITSNVWHHWKEAIRKNDLQNKINPKCLNIIEHMIRNPLDNEWTLKSMFITGYF